MPTVILVAYLIGSVPFALLLARKMGGNDLRSVGSGNLGAANVLRASGITAGVLVAVLDIAKGAASVMLAERLSPNSSSAAVAGVAAIVGHIYPVWLRFRGGKGVATAGGVLIALDWRLGLAVIVVWLTVAAISRYSSLGAIVAALFAPAAAWYLLGPGALFAAVCVMSAVLIARHRANIGKLARGEESRIGEKKAAPGAHTNSEVSAP
jgi:glycerol-3-phosphate acyltransferase PlsY